MNGFRHILTVVAVAVAVSVLSGGCVYDDARYGGTDDSEYVMLVLNVSLAVPSRAGADSDREKIHGLRIVLLDADDGGRVEYNVSTNFDSGLTAYNEGVYGFQLIRTTPGKKKIFLIANEESVKSVRSTEPSLADVAGKSLRSVLDRVNTSVGSAEFETLVNSICFAPEDYGAMEYIPLTSSYEFEIGEEDVGSRVPKTFYLVNAATKFEFEFVNNRNTEVTVDALSIRSIAKEMYLMAHFDSQPAESRTVEWSQNNQTRRAFWIDWLREVSDATQNNDRDPENERTNSTYGWITDYLLPADEHVTREVVAADPEPRVVPVFANSGKVYALPAEYCPESKNIDGQQQEYTVSVTLTDRALNSTRTFNETLRNSSAEEDGRQEDNLVALFRNTHVRVRFTLDYERTELDLHMHVYPWAADEPEIWDYVDNVTVQQQLAWTADSYESIDEQNGDVVLNLDSRMLEGTFNITAPVKGRWYARLTPIGDAKPNAVTFARADGEPMTPNAGDPAVCLEVSGLIDANVARLYIRPTNLGNDQESRFRLEFFVENLGMWMTVPIVDNGKQFNYYTIVRKANIIE